MTDAEAEATILARQWFYRFRLPSGRVTDSYLPDDIVGIHETRERMLNEVLESEFAGSWEDVRCLDLACHEGYFSHTLALKGCEQVLGVDARSEHVDHANLIRNLYGHRNLSFRVGDIQKIEAGELGRYDVTILLGILYHLENIVGALRLAQAVTRRICVIETQIAPDMSGDVDWGSCKSTKTIVGCLAIVDESEELSADNREANTSAITLVPSLPGLLWLLKAVGFAECRLLVPPPDAYEQLASGKRVMIAAYNAS